MYQQKLQGSTEIDAAPTVFERMLADLLSHNGTFPLTFFDDVYANRLTFEQDIRFCRLKHYISRTNAPTKDKLPLWSGARFGDKRTDKGNLRTRNNVEGVSVLIVDYDGEIVPWRGASQILTDEGITHIAYTSPHHRPDKPRWRIICPASREYEPEEYWKWAGRINGLLGRILAPESFDVERSYYYGQAKWVTDKSGKRTGERCAPVESHFHEGWRLIDQCSELPIAGPPEKPASGQEGGEGPIGLNLEETRQCLALVPHWVDDRHTWMRVGMAVKEEHGEAGYPVWDEWSQNSHKYDEEVNRDQWESYGRRKSGRRVTMATILGELRDRGLGGEVVGPILQRIETTQAFADMDDDELARDMRDLVGGGGALNPLVDRLNERNSVVRHKGKSVIAWHDSDGTVDYGPVKDFHTWYANDRVADKDGKLIPVSQIWLNSPDRRQYHRVVFDPSGQAADDVLNLWRGFAIVPKQGDCRPILDYIREVICSDNPEWERYVLGWLAHLFQKPAIKPGVVLVLIGERGAGKDTLGAIVRRMIGYRHVVQVNDPDRLTHNFNAQFEAKLFAHCEEAVWGGDRSKNSKLKSLITSERIPIERKGVDVGDVDCFLRFFMSANPGWAVPAEEGERRYAVFEVSKARVANVHDGDCPNRMFWNRFHAAIDDAMLAAFMHFLMNYDLSKFDVRQVPRTAALKEQKEHGLRGVAAWWHDVLYRGELPVDCIDDGDWSKGVVRPTCDDLHRSCENWFRERRYQGDAPTAATFGTEIRKLVPRLKRKQRRTTAGRVWLYVLPCLDDCRAHDMRR